MSTQAELKLVDLNDADAITHERREAARYVIGGRVTAVRKPPSSDEHRNCICSLELLNISDTGLGVVSLEPIELSSCITVIFPPHGPEHGIDLTGRVVRCMQRGDHDEGYEVGIQLIKRQAA